MAVCSGWYKASMEEPGGIYVLIPLWHQALRCGWLISADAT
ncbi:hypothetical protein EMIT0P74_240001 [Pseudomonas sp. IT-P74]